MNRLPLRFASLRDRLRRKPPSVLPVWASVLAVFLAAATLYALTAHYGAGGRVNSGDSAKFQYLPIVDGTPHSTGYPTYLLACKPAYWLLPFVPVAARIALLSVACGAGAVAVLFSLARSCTESAAAGLLSAALLATSLTFWLVCADAEVYALHSLFYVSVLACLARALRLSSSPARGGGACQARASLDFALLLYGLSFGNHLTTVALLPSVIYAVLRVEGRESLGPRRLAVATSCAVLGASQYGYVYYLSHRAQSPELEYVHEHVSVARLIDYVTGRQFQGRFFAYSVDQVLTTRLLDFAEHAARELSPVGLALAALGVARVVRRRELRAQAGLFGLAIAGQLALALNYAVESGLYYVPAYAVLSVLAGHGVRLVRFSRLALAAGFAAVLLGARCRLGDSRLSYSQTPKLRVARYQAAQARGCKQLLAAPGGYGIQKIRSYYRYSGDYPHAAPFTKLAEIESVDGLCVDAAMRRELSERGGFSFSPLEDALPAFLDRNREWTLLLATWMRDAALDPGSAAALRERGASLPGLEPGQAYVAVVRDGRVVADQVGPSGVAELSIDAFPAREGPLPGKRLDLLSRARPQGRRTSLRVGGHERGSRSDNFVIVVLDVELRTLGRVVLDSSQLPRFNVYWRAELAGDP